MSHESKNTITGATPPFRFALRTSFAFKKLFFNNFLKTIFRCELRSLSVAKRALARYGIFNTALFHSRIITRLRVFRYAQLATLASSALISELLAEGASVAS